MIKIGQREYSDGIAFYVDECEDDEIAFYSNITSRITYKENWDKFYRCYNCASIPIDVNCYIIDEVKKYRTSNINN